MIDAAERALLEETVRDAIADAARPRTTADVDAVLAELGWLEMLDAEPRDAIDIVFSALGATNARATALDDVLASALGAEPRADLAVLLPRVRRVGSAGPNRRRAALARAGSRPLAPPPRASCSWCAARRRSRGSVTVPIDGRRGARGARDRSRRRLPRGPRAGQRGGRHALDAARVGSAVALGRRAVAHQIAGASRAMLDLARTHALERVQFGRPIARFQAVRHRLADALVAVEALEATLAAAGDEPNSDTAALAKAVAGRTARTVAAHCQQVLAGIGFTTEHPFHRFLKRTMRARGPLRIGRRDRRSTSDGGCSPRARVPTLIEL